VPRDRVWIAASPEYVLEHGGRVTVDYEISQEWDRPKPAAAEMDAAARRKFYDVEEDARRRKDALVRQAIAKTYPNASIISLKISGRVATLVLEFRAPRGGR